MMSLFSLHNSSGLLRLGLCLNLKWFGVALMVFTSHLTVARADGLHDLEQFLTDIRSGRAEFTQTVVGPPKTGEQIGRSKVSSGRFEFLRPDRFRFDYQKPFAQTIVADGQTLWLYDVELNQVISRSQTASLGSTPAALLASGSSLAQLRSVFDVKADADADGLRWVSATPRERDVSLKSIRVGFAQGQLQQLVIDDHFGQRSTIRFDGFKLNVGVTPAQFVFKPPAGADVVKQ